MHFVFEQDSPDHFRDEEDMTMVGNTIPQSNYSGFYDPYNGGFGEQDDFDGSARYTGDSGDVCAMRLEGIMGHA